MTESSNKQWYEDRVEAFVANELPLTEADRFRARLQRDSQLQHQVAVAEGLQTALRDLPSPRVPHSLERAVIEATGTHWLPRVSSVRAGWLAATAASLALVVSMVWQQLPSEPGIEDSLQMTAADIAKGRHDLALALAYLDRSTTLASRKVGSAWVNDGLVKPVSAGLSRQRTDPIEEDAS